VADINYYRAFQGFGQAKFLHGGSVLALPPKIMLDSKVVTIDPKIRISLH
jgi:hypothetical protein